MKSLVESLRELASLLRAGAWVSNPLAVDARTSKVASDLLSLQKQCTDGDLLLTEMIKAAFSGAMHFNIAGRERAIERSVALANEHYGSAARWREFLIPDDQARESAIAAFNELAKHLSDRRKDDASEPTPEELCIAREAISKTGKTASFRRVSREVTMREQRFRKILRHLESLGEYQGFARRPPRRR